jgi:hypothetical protein
MKIRPSASPVTPDTSIRRLSASPASTGANRAVHSSPTYPKKSATSASSSSGSARRSTIV